MRLSGAAWLVLAAIVGLVIVVATDQVVPATSDYQAQMRVWLAARATGITAYLLLTGEVLFGLVLSHPTNQSTWRLSARLFPWHEHLLVFIGAFLAAHVVALLLDPWAGVGVAGTFIPGLSEYRSAPVALGTLALYALLVTGMTARWTRLLPRGVWLKLHRFAAVAWLLSWVHGLLAGTDSAALMPMYLVTGAAVLAAAAYRYWAARKSRPTFATSLSAEPAQPAALVGAGPAQPAALAGAEPAQPPALASLGPVPRQALTAHLAPNPTAARWEEPA